MCVLNFALEVRMAMYYIEPYHVAIIFATLMLVRYSIDLQVVLWVDSGEEFKNVGIDSVTKTPKMDDASQTPNTSSNTPPSGKNIALTSADYPSEHLSTEEKAIGTDTKMSEQEKTRLNLQLERLTEDLSDCKPCKFLDVTQLQVPFKPFK